jgi:uncharacterized protein
VEFEWDPSKAASHLAKHKVSFEEAATFLGDPLGLIVADPRHSIWEQRFALLGFSHGQHLLAVMYADGGEAISVISARRAPRSERWNYEENAS